MKFYGRIVNAQAEGVPSASVLLTDANGTPSGAGTQADENGYFAFYGDSASPYVTVSSIGYETQTMQYSENATVFLAQSSTMLADVVVTFKRKLKPVPGKPNYILPISLAGAGTIMLGVWIKFHFFS